MWAVSDAFRAALVKSHAVATKVELFSGSTKLKEYDVHVSGGVTIDQGAAVRRRCGLVLVDRDGTLTPGADTDPLTVYGNELRLWRGIQLPTGPELCPLGVFRIADVRIEDTKDGMRIEVDGYDRARAVSRARFEQPYTIASGTNYITAIRNLISSRVSGLEYNFPTTTRTTGDHLFTEEMDPWDEAVRMASGLGYDLFFDQLGVCTMRVQPDPETAPSVWTYAEGAQATILGVKRALSDEKAYNGIVVIGESTNVAVPVRAVRWITSGAMDYLGPYGKVPRYFRSEFVTTQAQADDAAAAWLSRLKGATEKITFPAVVNPAHDAGDVVRVTRAKSKVDRYYILDTINIPMEAATAMEAVTREARD